jgi:hypothetical protein
MTKIASIIAVLIGLCFLAYYLFGLSYDSSIYEIKNCGQKLRVVDYRNSEGRAFLFTKDIQSDDIPTDGFIAYPDFSGFDAFFQCILTCEHDSIIVNYYEGEFAPRSTATGIVSRRLSSTEYQWLKTRMGDSELTFH